MTSALLLGLLALGSSTAVAAEDCQKILGGRSCEQITNRSSEAYRLCCQVRTGEQSDSRTPQWAQEIVDAASKGPKSLPAEATRPKPRPEQMSASTAGEADDKEGRRLPRQVRPRDLPNRPLLVDTTSHAANPSPVDAPARPQADGPKYRPCHLRKAEKMSRGSSFGCDLQVSCSTKSGLSMVNYFQCKAVNNQCYEFTADSKLAENQLSDEAAGQIWRYRGDEVEQKDAEKAACDAYQAWSQKKVADANPCSPFAGILNAGYDKWAYNEKGEKNPEEQKSKTFCAAGGFEKMAGCLKNCAVAAEKGTGGGDYGTCRALLQRCCRSPDPGNYACHDRTATGDSPRAGEGNSGMGR